MYETCADHSPLWNRRSQIFELALHSSDRLDVTPALQQPALLWTCRQIRQEARAVWYASSTFHFTIQDCDDSLLCAFTKHVQDLEIEHPHTRVRLQGDQNWSNLVEWCHNVWHTRSIGVNKKDGQGAFSAIVAAAHEIAYRHDHASWAMCKAAWDNLEFVVRTLNSSWI